jgi:hypothetical protein
VWPRWSGPVGRDELDVDPLAGLAGVAPVRRAGGDDVGGHRALGAGLDAHVEEAGSGHLDRRDPGGGAQLGGEQLTERPRVGAGLLGQLHRDVRGVVAVPLLPGSLHDHLGRHAVGEDERAGVDEGRERVDDSGGELGGIHRSSLSARSGFSSISSAR